MKKRVIFIGVLASLFSVSFASAGPVESFETLFSGLIDVIKILFSYTSEIDTMLLAKGLLLLLVFIVVYSVLKKNTVFNLKGFSAILVSAIVAILSVRSLPDNEFINEIVLPYNIFGVAITVIFPFLCYLYAAHSISRTAIRRVVWIVYGAIYASFYFMRFSSGKLSTGVNYVYLFGFVLIIIVVIFDRAIHGKFIDAEVKGMETCMNNRQARSILKEMDELKEHYSKGRISPEDFDREMAELMARYKKLKR